MRITQPATGGSGGGGATSASALVYTPTGSIPIGSSNAQSAIDFLESHKVDKSLYDANGDGIVDRAATLAGLIATLTELNYVSGVTSSIQAQINAISSGTFFKGEYATKAAMDAAYTTPNPPAQHGYWVFITQDETHGNAKTQYYHDGTNWIFGGGVVNVPDANASTKGVVKLAGALGGTADAPQLAASGVAAGTYTNPTVAVSADGRITSAASGSSSVAWAAVSGRPASTPAAIDAAVSEAHTHGNQTVLDALSDTSGQLRYKSQSIGGSGLAGTVFPATGLYSGLQFYRTDLELLFIYNATAAAWIQN